MLKLLIGTVVLIVVVAVGVMLAAPSIRQALKDLDPSTKPLEVRTEKVTTGTVTELVQAPGEIVPHTLVDISARVSSQVLGLPEPELTPLRPGDEVKAGQIIVRLDDQDWQADMKSATASRAAASTRIESQRAILAGLERTLTYAIKRLERQEALYTSGDVAEKDLDDARERVDDLNVQLAGTKHDISVLKYQLESSDAEIRRAEINLANTVVRAPIDGVITTMNVEIGQTVLGTASNAGTVMMTIANMSDMVMRARVSESDIARTEVGQQSRIYVNAFPDETFDGTVRHIAVQRTAISDDNGHFDVEVAVDLTKWEQEGYPVKSGLQANVDIEIARREGLLVPSQAIVERVIEELPESLRKHPLVDTSKQVTRVVYCVKNGKAVCTPVRIGASDLTNTIVAEGLDDDGVVIVGPYKALESLKHDQLVKDSEAKDSDEATAGETEETTEDAGEPDANAAARVPSS